MRRVVPLLLALAACTREAPPDGGAFADLTVMLPDDPGVFPIRAGSAEMTRHCTACHSPSMILLQPALTTDQWTAEIDKMKTVYKAPVDPAAEPAILAYLEATSAAFAPPAVARQR